MKRLRGKKSCSRNWNATIPAGAEAAGSTRNATRLFDEKIRKIQEEGHIVPGHELIKTPEQIAAIRESCAINIAVLDYVAEHIQAGISTEQIDQWVYQITTERGGIPAPLNYEDFQERMHVHQ